MTPYETLGVAADATDVQIKRAYRRLVKKLHPDMPTGNAEAFDQVQKAYDLLIDPVRRHRFDETGADETQPDTKTAAALTDISAALTLILADLEEARYTNIVNGCRDLLDVQLTRARTALPVLQETCMRFEKMLRRITPKEGGQDVITPMIRSRLNLERRNMLACQDDIAALERSLELLDGMEDRPEVRETPESAAKRDREQFLPKPRKLADIFGPKVF